MITTYAHKLTKPLFLLLIAWQIAFAYGHSNCHLEANADSHLFTFGRSPMLTLSASDSIRERLQHLFAVDSALAHTYMSYVVVHSDAIMATDYLPVAVFCTSGRFEGTSITLTYSELVSPQLADSINAIAGQNLLLLTMADYFDNGTYLSEKHTADIEEVFRQLGMPVSAPSPSQEKQAITLYPNPANGTVSLRVPFKPGTPCTVQVVNLAGQIMFKQQFAYHDGITLSLYELPAGTYVVTAQGNGKRFAERLFLVR